MPWYLVDSALIALFVVQHSVGTTAWAKKFIARLAGGRPYAWNAIYNGGTVACIWALIHYWQTSGTVIWDVPSPWSTVMWGVEAATLGVFFYLFKFTQPFGEWIGYAQIIRAARGLSEPAGEGYKVKRFGIKRYIRFPHHTTLIVLFWCLPHMTGDLCLLALEATVYTWLGSLHQDLRGHSYFKDEWLSYRQNSRMLFPAVEHIAEDIQAWVQARRARLEAKTASHAPRVTRGEAT